jgi:hypothetical protein
LCLHHWAIVTRLDLDGAPTQEQLAEAALVHDIRIMDDAATGAGLLNDLIAGAT